MEQVLILIVFTNMGNANYTLQCSLNNGTTDVSAWHMIMAGQLWIELQQILDGIQKMQVSQVDLALLDALVLGDLA